MCYRSKRMSKVKTLQLAIEYINQLQGVLSLQAPPQNHIVSILVYIMPHVQNDIVIIVLPNRFLAVIVLFLIFFSNLYQVDLYFFNYCSQNEPEHHQLLTTADINLFSDVQYKLEPSDLQFRMPPNFYTQLLTDNQN